MRTPTAVRAIAALDAKYRDRLRVDPSLTRQLVSFQANKERPRFRWYKYKEAFSASLVEHFIERHDITGEVLDPFAGMGTTLFAASALGLDATGIELLPIGREIVRTRQLLESSFSDQDLDILKMWRDKKPWRRRGPVEAVPELRITAGAYPPDTVTAMERYLGEVRSQSERIGAALRLALLCVLESISFTRKDGQYLRWDYRSGRRQGSRPFDKGRIAPFDEAVCAKLDEMIGDTEGGAVADLFHRPHAAGRIRLIPGSCLDVLPEQPADQYQAVITSPPYCNRYDYTRTYALELALLGVDEPGLVALRQEMLSCTVENRSKDLLAKNAGWAAAVAVADRCDVLQAVLAYLEEAKAGGELNNPGIPRMVRGYFYEMTCVIAECARVLRPGGVMVVVNDNVRYAGSSIPVDLILSEAAERLGLVVEAIHVLPNGKGNSSQQMGAHGRDPLRKGVYVWRKP